MILEKLYLQDFRAFENQTFTLSPETTVFIAANGSGKTTILEAISLLSTGKSFRAEKNQEMLKFQKEIARVYGLLEDNTRLGVTVTTGIVAGRKVPSKTFTLGQAKKKQKDFIGQLLAISFRPEDLRLIEGSPPRRRDYLDQALILTSKVYQEALTHYQSTLIRRNRLLTDIREGLASLDSLPYWNENLLTFGEIIHQKRADFCQFLNKEVPFELNFQVTYDHSIVSRERLAKYQGAEIASGHSLIGPHRDDFDILFDFADQKQSSVTTYGSRGQQRLATLWLKLGQWQFLRQKTKQKPILLLDDILSELDDERQNLVLSLLTKQQTIITTTEEQVLKKIKGKKVKIIRL